MNDWIDKESENIRKELDEQEQTAYLTDYCNFWAALIQQIKIDVGRINNDANFQSVFNEQITVSQSDNGYRIRKPSFPAAFSITVEVRGKEVLVEIDYKLDMHSKRQITPQKLKVESDGRGVYLTIGENLF